MRPLLGFEMIQKGDLAAVDGGNEIRSTCDGCTIFMPTHAPVVGREGGVYDGVDLHSCKWHLIEPAFWSCGPRQLRCSAYTGRLSEAVVT